MSIVEKLQNLVENPVPQSRIDKLQEDINFAVQSYYNGDFSKDDLEYILKALNEENDILSVVLKHAGPFYGLLRKINIDQEAARSIADEERAHYFAAKENNIPDPYFVIHISQENERRFLNAFVAYKLDFTLPDNALKKTIYNISTAPQNPSPDDLAKLPSYLQFGFIQ